MAPRKQSPGTSSAWWSFPLVGEVPGIEEKVAFRQGVYRRVEPPTEKGTFVPSVQRAHWHPVKEMRLKG